MVARQLSTQPGTEDVKTRQWKRSPHPTRNAAWCPIKPICHKLVWLNNQNYYTPCKHMSQIYFSHIWHSPLCFDYIHHTPNIIMLTRTLTHPAHLCFNQNYWWHPTHFCFEYNYCTPITFMPCRIITGPAHLCSVLTGYSYNSSIKIPMLSYWCLGDPYTKIATT